MKICVECKYFKEAQYAQCTHPRNIDPVTGKPQIKNAYGMRENDGPCGPEALLFTGKEPLFPEHT